jgi:hypothetical protein
MNFLKNLGGRIRFLIVGLLCTMVGAVLVYYDFKQSTRYPNSGGMSSYPIGLTIAGVVCLIMVFGKKKTTETEVSKKTPDNPA